MKPILLVLVLAVAVSSCSQNRGRTKQMFPDCTQVSAEEQAKGNCIHRPEAPQDRD